MTGEIPAIKEFPNDGQTWRIEWFNGIERDQNLPSEPKAQLVISPMMTGSAPNISSPSSFDDEQRKIISVGVGQLPLLQLGSLWRYSLPTGQLAGQIITFTDLFISSDTVRLVPSNIKDDHGYVIPWYLHRIKPAFLSHCLAIERNGDPFAIMIPVMEVIRFYYAETSRQSKAIFNGLYRIDLNKIINPERSFFDAEKKRCHLQLRMRFRNADTWIIGRLLCSREAYQGAIRVYDSIMQQKLQRRTHLYPETSFPFQGNTTLKTRGISHHPNGAAQPRHLIFAIESCSGAFPYDSLSCRRDNDNRQSKTKNGDIEKNKIPGYGNMQANPAPSGGLLQSALEPNAALPPYEILTPSNRFTAIANFVLIQPEKYECRYKKATSYRFPLPETNEMSTGDGNYQNSKITPAYVEAYGRRQVRISAKSNHDSQLRIYRRLGSYPGCSGQEATYASRTGPKKTGR